MKNTREDILDCARDIYLEHGLQGLSMRKVAVKVGITPMAIYRHFENKEDLLEQLFIRGFKTFGSYLYRGMKGETPLEKIRLTAMGYLDFATEQSKYFEIIFMAIDPTQELKVNKMIREEAQITFRFLVDRVRECTEAGVFRKEPPFDIALILLSQANGLVSLYLTRSFEWTPEEFRQMFGKTLERVLKQFLA